MKKHGILVFVLVLFSCTALTHPLGDLSASMQPKSWAKLEVNGFTWSIANADGGNVFNYAESAVWDPQSKSVFFIGKGYGGRPYHFISYSEATNTVTRMPDAPWFCCNGHGYDCNAIDPASRSFYFHKSGSNEIYKYHIDNGNWSRLPLCTNCSGTYANGEALEYFPEMHGLIRSMYHQISYYNPSTQKWTEIGKLNDIGGCHNAMEYSPAAKAMLMGGGDYQTSDKLYKMDASGRFTPLGKPPLQITSARTLVTLEPVTGKFLVLQYSTKKFYAFDMIKDEWENLPDVSWVSSIGSNGVGVSVATPISDYGVVMYLNAPAYQNGEVWLYKYAEDPTTTAWNAGRLQSLAKISASPNPFTSTTVIRINCRLKIEDCRLKIYDVNGKMVNDFTSKIKNQQSSILNQITWNACHLAPGIYIIKASRGNQEITKKITLFR